MEHNMTKYGKAFLLLVPTISVFLLANGARAQEIAGGEPYGALPETPASARERGETSAAIPDLQTAAHWLDQAALQWDRSSDDQKLSLLQSAQDRLASVIDKLCCARQARAIRLQTNIHRTIVRALAQLDPLGSATGASFGPPTLNRDELSDLAKEGEALLRDTPAMPLGQRADELRAARSEGVQRQAQHADTPTPVASPLSDSWSGFPSEQPQVPSFGFNF
jgi:hypothetical protein